MTQPGSVQSGQAAAPSVGGEVRGEPPASPGSNIDADGAAALLDRMEVLLNASLSGNPTGKIAKADKPVGTSGVVPGVDAKSSAGRVTVDRAALDELLAEAQQLRSMLRVVTK